MRKLLAALADTVRWGEPFAHEDDEDDVIVVDGRDDIPSAVTPGTVIAL